MFRENLYSSLVACLNRHPNYLKKSHKFITNHSDIKKFLEQFSAVIANYKSDFPLNVHLVGEKHSGKLTLARHLYGEFYCQKAVVFMTVFELIECKDTYLAGFIQQRIFLYFELEKYSREQVYNLIKDLVKNQRIECIIFSSGSCFSFKDTLCFFSAMDLKLNLPIFLDRNQDKYLLLSYFISQLYPSVTLSSRAFFYYAKNEQFKTVFDLKYTLLLAHYKTNSQSTQVISYDVFRESYNFFLIHKKKFKIIEEIDLSLLSFFVKEIGFKKFIDFMGEILLEKIFFDSKKSYTRSSSYTLLPITTIRSKRMKYLTTCL